MICDSSTFASAPHQGDSSTFASAPQTLVPEETSFVDDDEREKLAQSKQLLVIPSGLDTARKLKSQSCANDILSHFPDWTNAYYSVLGDANSNITKEEDGYCGMIPHYIDPKTMVRLYNKSIEVTRPVVMPNAFVLPYKGMVYAIAIEGRDANHNPVQTSQFKLIVGSMDNIKRGAGTSASMNGLLDLGHALHTYYRDNHDPTVMHICPLHRFLGGGIYTQYDRVEDFDAEKPRNHASVIQFAGNVPHVCSYLHVDLLTAVMYNESNTLIQSMPADSVCLSRVTRLDNEMDPFHQVYSEWWRLTLPVYPTVPLNLNAHGYKITVRYPDKMDQSKLYGLYLSLHVAMDMTKIGDVPDLFVYEKGSTLSLLDHPLLWHDGRVDPEDLNCSLAVRLNHKEDLDLLERRKPFELVLLPAAYHAFPSYVTVGYWQYWTEYARIYSSKNRRAKSLSWTKKSNKKE